MADTAGVAQILETLVPQDFEQGVNKARRLVGMDGTLISGGINSMSTSYIQELYTRRAANRDLPPSVAQQTERMVRVAAAFPAERWYIHGLENGGERVWILSNEAGIGRACIDLDPP